MALNLPLDEKLSASINRRRIAEDQRKRCIFDNKRRQIGIDVEALNYQVHNSHLTKARDYDREKEYAEQVKRNANLANYLEQQYANKILEENKKIDEYRQQFQRPEYRRDFDLYDPDQKKKECPPRLSDDDPCPVSNLQKLEGEDLNYKDRRKKQQEQVRDILLQQMLEKRFENHKKDNEFHEWEKAIINQNKTALQLAKMEAEHSKKCISNLKNDNKILALQNKERNLHQKIIDDIDKRKDIEYNFYGPILSEDPSVARSNQGPHRVVADRWKGMSKEQLEEIYHEQLKQISENQRRKEKEQHENSLWNQQVTNQQKMAMLSDDEKRKQHLQFNKNLELMNQKLSQEQKLHHDYMNKVAFKNSISKDFYSQFNTSSR